MSFLCCGIYFQFDAWYNVEKRRIGEFDMDFLDALNVVNNATVKIVPDETRFRSGNRK